MSDVPEMVRRVALAIGDARASVGPIDPLKETVDDRRLARAAIAAMREPTAAMIDAGGEAADLLTDGVTMACWRAMIDAALS